MKPEEILTFADDTPDDVREAITAYLKPFEQPNTRPKAGMRGEVLCRCGVPLDGILGTFSWGLTHGEGFCSSCHQPVRMFHVVRDDKGKILGEFDFPLLYPKDPEGV